MIDSNFEITDAVVHYARFQYYEEDEDEAWCNYLACPTTRTLEEVTCRECLELAADHGVSARERLLDLFES